MLQIESHPFLSQERLLRLARDYDLPVTAFSPLGALSYVELGMAEQGESLLETPVVLSAAQRLGRTPHRCCCAGVYSGYRHYSENNPAGATAGKHRSVWLVPDRGRDDSHQPTRLWPAL